MRDEKELKLTRFKGNNCARAEGGAWGRGYVYTPLSLTSCKFALTILAHVLEERLSLSTAVSD